MAPERKRFSVCIPAYNRAGHLSALLDSVFAQEYQNFELVICEDDSSQRNQITEIVAGYSRRYPNVRQRRQGRTHAGRHGTFG